MVVKAFNVKILPHGQQLAFQPQHHGQVKLLKTVYAAVRHNETGDKKIYSRQVRKRFFVLDSQILCGRYNVDQSPCLPFYSRSKEHAEYG